MKIKLVSLALYGISAVAAQHVRANLHLVLSVFTFLSSHGTPRRNIQHPSQTTYVFPNFKPEVTSLRVLSRILGKGEDGNEDKEAKKAAKEEAKEAKAQEKAAQEAAKEAAREKKALEKAAKKAAQEAAREAKAQEKAAQAEANAQQNTGVTSTSDSGGDPDDNGPDLKTILDEAKQAVKNQKESIEGKEDELKEYLKSTEYEEDLEELERLQKKRDEHQQYLEYYKDDDPETNEKEAARLQKEVDKVEQKIEEAEQKFSDLNEKGIALDLKQIAAENRLGGTTDPDERKRLEKVLKEISKDMREVVKELSKTVEEKDYLKDVVLVEKERDLTWYTNPIAREYAKLTIGKIIEATDDSINKSPITVLEGQLSDLKSGLQTLKDEEDTAHDEYKEWLKQLKQARQDEDDDDDKKDDSDDSDESDHRVYYVGDFGNEDRENRAACVEPVLCSEAVENFMRHFLGNERRLLASVDEDRYCNEPDVVEAWGAGNGFAAFLDDDDLRCIIAKAKDLLDTTASRTRYLRGLAELTVNGLGDQLLAKEKNCGHSEEEIECMDQWRCNIEEKCVEEILNGKDHCFGILDYVTSCYIWCVGIL